MQSAIQNLIETRISVNNFDPQRSISDHTVSELVRLATRAPSAYNLQNWKFIAVRSAEAKARLKSVAYGQHKVVAAAVTFIICGTLQAHTWLAEILKPSVEAGIIGASVADVWINMATDAHVNNAQWQRDEAMRSASLAAMTLMLAAQGMGLVSCAMSGFDTSALAYEFKLQEDEIPVILVTVGYPAEGNWPQKVRRPLEKVMEFV